MADDRTLSKDDSLITMEDPRYPQTGEEYEMSSLGTHNGNANSNGGGGGSGDGNGGMSQHEDGPSSMASKRSSSERSLPLRSYNKWCPTEQGATLVWRDLCVYTSGERGSTPTLYNMKRIINNSTGAVQPGNLMALMGSRCAFKIIQFFFVVANFYRNLRDT